MSRFGKVKELIESNPEFQIRKEAIKSDSVKLPPLRPNINIETEEEDINDEEEENEETEVGNETVPSERKKDLLEMLKRNDAIKLEARFQQKLREEQLKYRIKKEMELVKNKDTLEYTIRSGLSNFKRKFFDSKVADNKAKHNTNVDNYINFYWFRQQALSQNGQCCLCMKTLKFSKWSRYDPDQFVFDKENRELPYIQSNTKIICFACKKLVDKNVYF
jgi:hypothetical protein